MSFIKVAFSDNKHYVELIGQLIEQTENDIVLQTKEGKFTLPIKKLKVTILLPHEIPSRSLKTSSKMGMSIEIYKGMMKGGEHPQRSIVLKRLVKELDMNESTASSYIQTIKKNIKLGRLLY